MELYATSVEYAEITITADVDLTGAIEVAFLPWNASPDAATAWHLAEWVGDPGPTRSCRLLLAGTAVSPVPAGAVVLPAAQHWTWVRLPDNPEVIIRRASTLLAR